MANKLSQESILKRFEEVHGDKYDYSLVNYINSRTKIKIICSEHGVFEQNVNSHLSGKNCFKCSDKKYSKEEVIKQFKLVHGNKYDYSLVEYKNKRTNVKIICSKHGVFEKRLDHHRSGSGCISCLNELKRNDKIIQEFKKTHKDKYDYSHVDYKNNNTKIKILCSIHGEFEQTPKSHKKGYGCIRCSGLRLTKEEVLSDFKKAHGDKYNYSLVDYKNNNTKIKIICSEHGVFEQLPYSHKNGSGCGKCENKKLTKEEVIQKMIKTHGYTYDYSLVDYENHSKKVNIICKKHGIFKQSISSHLRGSGCPICKLSAGELMIRKILDKNLITIESQKKFDECKNLNHLLFDFYLPEYNTCIEYHGLQHFKKNNYFGGEKEFIKNKKRDKIKEKFCKDNSISLIIIFGKYELFKEYNFVDLYNNSPISIINIFLQNKIEQIEMNDYIKFKKSFNFE